LIERLGSSDFPALLNLFTEAFADYPLNRALGISKPEAVRRLMKAFLDFFGGAKSGRLHGIREDDKIVCASLSVDSTEEPGFFRLMRFILSLTLAVGWKAAERLGRVAHEQAPKYKERYLELVQLATLPAYQGRGLGRKMLRFLYDEARKEGYKGVTLVTVRDTPAFRLYLGEGFVVEKEIGLEDIKVCHMRLVF
jgi:ribosomal protein S18 acetylase RimI-like enzyme